MMLAIGMGELDRDALRRCKQHDPIAMRAFVVHYQSSVFALLSRLLGKTHPYLEDVAQEVFVRAYRAFPGFDLDRDARASTWLLTIATRLALNERKRRVFAALPIDAKREPPAPTTPETERSRRELGRAIEAAAATLSADQRAVFVLAEYHGWSVAAMARALEIPENTAKTRLFRAREKMRALLLSWSSNGGASEANDDRG
ncbi:sigma-70 family RNA polymerase sigma factor [Pendulispora rubella]|uniref:Sigma-70 family RNA polymerase sigma factor n=1 Tax=Pendulispora rubella TaxID=2741070 RepID=A0ABZ2L7P5_9BACT